MCSSILLLISVNDQDTRRMMKRNPKKDNGDVYVCAMLKHNDATTQEYFNQTIHPAYQQELLGIVLAVRNRRNYMESAMKITCMTGHATPLPLY